MEDKEIAKRLIPKKAFKQIFYCPECDTELWYTGTVYLANPTKYKHICPECGETQDLLEISGDVVFLDPDNSDSREEGAK